MGSTHNILSPENKKKNKKKKDRRKSHHSQDDTTIIHKENVQINGLTCVKIPKPLVGHRESLIYKETAKGKMKRGVTLTKDVDNKSNSDLISKKGKTAKWHKEEQNALDGLRHSSHRDIITTNCAEDIDDEKVQKKQVQIQTPSDTENERLKREKEDLKQQLHDLKHQL